MSIPLKQSTASQEIPLGIFVDSTDGNTEEAGLTIANTDIKLWKQGATTLASKNSGGATYISNGIYYCVLDATDTDTLGGLVVFIHVSGALAVRVECCVLTANNYDAAIAGTITAAANVTQISGDSAAADNAEAFFDGTGYAGTNNVIPLVTTTTTATTATNVTTVNGLAANVITAASIANNAIGATEIADGAITAAKFAAGAIDATAIANGAIDAATFAAGAIDATAIANGAIDAATFAAGAIDAAALAADAATEIATAVLTAATAAPIAANIEQVNTVPLVGDGAGTPWGP
jgi:hypothetical protein